MGNVLDSKNERSRGACNDERVVGEIGRSGSERKTRRARRGATGHQYRRIVTANQDCFRAVRTNAARLP